MENKFNIPSAKELKQKQEEKMAEAVKELTQTCLRVIANTIENEKENLLDGCSEHLWFTYSGLCITNETTKTMLEEFSSSAYNEIMLRAFTEVDKITDEQGYELKICADNQLRIKIK